MMSPWRTTDGTATGWSAWLSMLLLTVAVCACAIDEAHGAGRAAARGDGGVKRGVGERKRVGPDAAANATAAVPEPQESLVGLTRAQVKAREGRPTEERGHEWIYTPDQPGCRDIIISEIITFKGGVVVSVRMQRSQTHKMCGRADRAGE